GRRRRPWRRSRRRASGRTRALRRPHRRAPTVASREHRPAHHRQDRPGRPRAPLGRNSANSSLPPSSDRFQEAQKKPAPKSTRKRGRQNGAEGFGLPMACEPGQTIDHLPATCTGCAHGLHANASTGYQRRQVRVFRAGFFRGRWHVPGSEGRTRRLQAEYAAVVLLVAPLVTAIFAFGPPTDVRTLYAEGLCRITEEANCDEDGNPGEPPGAVPSPQPSPGEGTGRNPMRRARTLRRTKRKPMKYVQAGKDEGRGTYLFDPRPYLDR